jgi:hypothetical protein
LVWVLKPVPDATSLPAEGTVTVTVTDFPDTLVERM